MMEVTVESIRKDKQRVGWFHWAVLFASIPLIVYSQSHNTVAVEVPVGEGVGMTWTTDQPTEEGWYWHKDWDGYTYPAWWDSTENGEWWPERIKEPGT